MSPRKSSMLEAFHRSNSSPTDVSTPSALPPVPSVSSDAPRAPRPAPGPLASGGPSVPERAPVFVLAGLGLVALLAGAFALGRVTARPAAAAGPADGLAARPGARSDADGDRAATPRSAWELREEAPSVPTGQAGAREVQQVTPAVDALDADGRTADDRAFYDNTNRFTVRAIRYANSPNGWRHALSVYRYLREQGFPAIAPIDQGDLIVQCVGAEPAREGRLEELRNRLQTLPGPPPQRERGAFGGAYFDNIDNLIDRPAQRQPGATQRPPG